MFLPSLLSGLGPLPYQLQHSTPQQHSPRNNIHPATTFPPQQHPARNQLWNIITMDKFSEDSLPRLQFLPRTFIVQRMIPLKLWNMQYAKSNHCYLNQPLPLPSSKQNNQTGFHYLFFPRINKKLMISLKRCTCPWMGLSIGIPPCSSEYNFL